MAEYDYDLEVPNWCGRPQALFDLGLSTCPRRLPGPPAPIAAPGSSPEIKARWDAFYSFWANRGGLTNGNLVGGFRAGAGGTICGNPRLYGNTCVPLAPGKVYSVRDIGEHLENASIHETLAGSLAVLATNIGLGFIMPAWGTAAQNFALQTYKQTEQDMALNLSGILSAAGTALGGINNPYTQAFGAIANIGAAAIAPNYVPQPVSQPVYGGGYPAIPVGTRAPVGPSSAGHAGSVMLAGTGGAALTQVVRGIVGKISGTLGKTLSVASATALLRKLAKFFTSPEAIATYLGVTVGELYQLYAYSSARKRRRMNPANSHALRRAARRIKSFHRLCQHTDLLKSRGRRGARSCGTCRKSPCRC